ncbi:MAG: class I tRNA ligase family protein [Candidatus Ozemobacteraceae bacterium]
MPASSPETSRPVFPRRVVITGGMPYGNKELHFGHVGGMYVHADAFARFLRDRIGAENVLFVSGTDCYGSPIVEYHRQMTASGKFSGTIEEFVTQNHLRQREILDAYGISLDLFAASGLGRSKEIHREFCQRFFSRLHESGHLLKLSTPQFFDPKAGVFLNGRQVTGQCPIPGCKSETGYADECALGHPYEPRELINPRSALSGEKPEMRTVSNWYIDLEAFRGELTKWVKGRYERPECRSFAIKAMEEFLEPPAIYVKPGQNEPLATIQGQLPSHSRTDDKNGAAKLVFEKLADRETASAKLTQHGIRCRNGKTLVPFRLTGNIAWGVPVPELPEAATDPSLRNLTFWVWPESLWAPLSFTATCLEKRGLPQDAWRDWWCAKEAQVFQFIGEDNIYFYSLAEMSMFMGDQGKTPTASPPQGQMQLPELVVNNHILFFDKKASSSGAIKPPMAHELLEHYTPDQLRTHFLALGLGIRSVGFKPRPFNPAADPREGDPVLKEGNLLCNVFNRAVRSCFYTVQKYFDGRIPAGPVSQETVAEAKKTVLAFELAMTRHEFHQAISLMDGYLRGINKFWSTNVKPGVEVTSDDPTLRQSLIDAFHMVRVATVLMHPIAPFGTEMIREYLNVGPEFWSWERIFEPVTAFFGDQATHQLKFLEPRVDFFPKHPSQVGT